MSIVARLRELLTLDRNGELLVAFRFGWRSFRTTDLAALLDVVERFAATEPLDFICCVYCQGHEAPDYPLRHDPDCPWLAARRACGMEPANAEDGDA